MAHPNVFTKLSLSGLSLLALFLLTPVAGAAQSKQRDFPTVITSFPIRGNLGTGTYYYRVPEAMVPVGEVGARLTFDPPDGGGSVTANFSGRRCCDGEATLGQSTGYAEEVQVHTTFTVPGIQSLLVTIDVSVADKETIEFRLGMAASGAPLVVTPPPAAPPATPATTTGGLCTDLGVANFSVAGQTGLTREITGSVWNLTTTHPYKGYPRGQWIEVFDITDSAKEPRRVGFVRLPDIIEPGASTSYRVVDTLTDTRRTRYMVKIVYSRNHATDRSVYNDDCNTANNSTRLQVMSGGEILETIPKARP